METRPTAAPDPAQAAVDRAGAALRGARVTLVVARARNGAIGRDNGLPWHLPEDLKHFRRLTTGHAIVMGRRTFESIGRPLPSRRNVVVSRTPGFAPDGVEVAASLDDALARCAGLPEVFVIGGARLFRDALPIADRAVVTELDADFEGDTFFEPLDARDWQAAERVEARSASGVPYAIVTYQRRGRS